MNSDYINSFAMWTMKNKERLNKERAEMGLVNTNPSGSDKLDALYRAVLANEEKEKRRQEQAQAKVEANKALFKPESSIAAHRASSYNDKLTAADDSMSRRAQAIEENNPYLKDIADRTAKARELENEAEKYASYRKDSYNGGKSYVMSNNPEADNKKRSALLEEADKLKMQNVRSLYENQAKNDPYRSSYITAGYPKAGYFNSDKIKRIQEGKLDVDANKMGVANYTSKVAYDPLHYLDGNYMSQDERETYQYLLGKGDESGAKQYLKSIATDVNARSSAAMQ